MNNLLSQHFKSEPGTSPKTKRFWIYSLSLILALWAGGTIVLDFVVMPSLANAGMMSSSNFIPAGFSIFHRFNGAEVIIGSLIMSGTLALLIQNQISHRGRLALISTLLFLIPCIYFFVLSPQMAGIGLTSDLSAAPPEAMNSMHYLYWVLDLLKVSCVGLYLSELWQSSNQSAMV